MTAPICLRDIPFDPNIPHLLQKMRLTGREAYAERFTRLAREAAGVARPKGIYRLAFVDSRTDSSVTVENVTLTSRVLTVNLGDVHRVFPFIATCGVELQLWSQSVTDMLERFWVDAIMGAALRSAWETLRQDIARRYELGQTAIMNPGSLADWPLEEQRNVFKLLGDPHETIGVKLTDSMLMVPIKSISGLCFPTEVKYENCQLCPRDPCPGRRAPYDPELYASRYAPH